MNSPEKLKNIVIKELKKGKSPESVFKLAFKAKVSKPEILKTFTNLAQLPTFPFALKLNNFLKKQKNKKNEVLITDKIWDPVGKKITKNFLDSKNKKIQEKLKLYTENPKLPLRNLLLFSIPGVLALIALIFFYKPILKDDSFHFFVLSFLSFLPVFIYWYKVRELQKDLIKFIVAEENNWFYNPKESTSRWIDFRNFASEFFQKGDKGQNMQDEFWGKFQGKKKEVDFYSSVFEYKIVHRDSKGRKSTTTKNKTIFAIHLDKKLKSDFRLEPDTVGGKFMNFFTKKNIDTESSEFNNAFDVYYAGKKDEKALGIVETLSPKLQTNLIKLLEHEKFSLMFRNDVVIFMINGVLLKKMKTNFFRDVKLDPADKQFIENRINTILDISSEMVKYLD